MWVAHVDVGGDVGVGEGAYGGAMRVFVWGKVRLFGGWGQCTGGSGRAMQK